MAGIIKGQILKHLSKFTKNLAPDKINVSTLKGEGELHSLELDEEVLMELLDLPTWLRVSKAVCNRVAIKVSGSGLCGDRMFFHLDVQIQWTKLKSQPICLYLDEIVVEMETCEKPRKFDSSSPISSYSTGGKYGFAERIIDGMYVSINSVVVNFHAKAFAASIQMSRIIIQSMTPTWQNGDLRLTRIKDDLRGEIIIFKEAEYQTLRIEANALEGADPGLATTPLRLIANQSKIRISIKKRLIDCGIVSSRLQVNLDDLLWVLTDSQMKAALGFVKSLRDVIKKSNLQSKKMAAEKLRSQGHLASPSHSSYQLQQQQQMQRQQQQRNMSRSDQAIAQLFEKYDIRETSYHLYTTRIDLHLCDDSAPGDQDYKRRVEGGAMQLTFHKLCFDYYPFHPAGGDRSHWLRYDENMAARDIWARDLLDAFKEEVKKVREALTPKTSPEHSMELLTPDLGSKGQPPPGRGQGQPPSGRGQGYQSQGQGHQGQGQRPPGSQGQRVSGPPQGVPPANKSSPSHQSSRPTKLLENSVIVRLEDFFLYRVSTARDNKRNAPKKFLSSDKKQLLLPPEMSSVHLEYTDYYFPDGYEYPIPHSNIYMMINPVRLVLDYLTVVWLNAFSLNLLKRADIPVDEGGPKVHTDIKLEALMPRIILPAETEVFGQSDRPDAVQMQISRMVMTNSRMEHKSSYQELSTLMNRLERGNLFSKDSFPNDLDQLLPVPSVYRSHSDRTDSPYLDKTIGELLLNRGVPKDLSSMTRSDTSPQSYQDLKLDSLKLDALKDVWCVVVDQFWLEFTGVPSSKNRPVPFMESFPITMWVARPLVAMQGSCHSNGDAKGSSPSHTTSHMNGDVSHVPERTEKSRKSKLLKEYYSLDDDEDKEKSTTTTASQNGLETPTDVSRLSDIHILFQIGSRVSLQVNHYQYLFLMRLIETITRTLAEVDEDTQFILTTLGPPKKFGISLVVDEVEIALVCPPLRELPSLQHHVGDSTDDREQDDIPEEAAKVIVEVETGGHDQGALESTQAGTTSHPIDDDEDSSDTIPTSISKSDTDMLSTPTSSADDLSPQESTPDNSALRVVYSEEPQLHMPGDSSPRICISDGGSVSMVMGSGSPSRQSPLRQLQGQGQGHPGHHSHQPLDKKNSDLKKSFNSAFTSLSKITSKVKRELLEIGDESSGLLEDWETVSVKSGSSDDEDFMILKFQNESEMPAFVSSKPMADDAASTMDTGSDMPEDVDSNSTSFTTSSGIDRPKGMVSVVCFRLVNAECIIQVIGADTVVTAQVDHIIPVEHGNVNLDRFQAKFAADWPTCHHSRHNLFTLLKCLQDHRLFYQRLSLRSETKGSQCNGYASGAPVNGELVSQPDTGERREEVLPTVKIPPVEMRFQIGPKASSFSPKAVELGCLSLRTRGLSARLLMSSITNLMDLIEDERIPENLPMLIEVFDACITLKDDKPPTHMTSPGTVPLNLHVSNAVVKRTDDGTFHVTAHSSEVANSPTFNPGWSTVMSASMTQTDDEDMQGEGALSREQLQSLEVENEQFRRQLEKFGKMSSSTAGQSIESLQREVDHLKEDSMRADVLQRENVEMLGQLKKQTKELLLVKQERETLLLTIQQLQEELQASEHMRNRMHNYT